MLPGEGSAFRVLITGASGFLGTALVREAAATGMEVRATGRSNSLPFSGIDYCRADILEPDSLPAAMNGMENVIHAGGLAHIFDKSTAAIVSLKAVNETGTANVARAAAQAGVRHFVLISSVAVYGASSPGTDENSVCRPAGPYAESKLQAEQRAIEIAKASGMRLTILRLATVYGEGDPGNVARLMWAIARGRFIWVGNGSNRKSLIYREDAARACVSVLRTSDAGINIYNVSAAPCTMRDLVEGLASALGRRLPRWHVPASLGLRLAWMVSALAQGRGRLGSMYLLAQKWLADDVYAASKFERAFGFQVRVSLPEGLQREVAWYCSLGRQPNA